MRGRARRAVPLARLVQSDQRSARDGRGAEKPEPARGDRGSPRPADRACGPGRHAPGPDRSSQRRRAEQLSGAAEMAELKVTQTKSKIGGTSAQRNSLRSLGLHRIGETVIKADRPEIRGMIQVVRHLVTVEEVH